MSRWRLWICAVAVLSYGVLACLFLAGRSHHFQVVLMALLYVVVLPATVHALRSGAAKGERAVAAPHAAWFLVAYLVPALAMSWVSNRGLLIPDESTYQFEARLLAEGKLAAAAPPGSAEHVAETPIALRFEHHIIDGGRWFGKYPLGWPLMLALGLRLGAGWVMNPLLGLAILLGAFAIARRLYDFETATLAVLLTVLSPFFLANCVGRMSHPTCGALLVGACLLCFEGLRKVRVAPLVGMFLLVGAACHVRPLTAAAVGGTLGLAALWYMRREPTFGRVLAAGCAIGTLTVGTVLFWNNFYTGQYLRSPYQMVENGMPDIDLRPSHLLHQLTHQTRWASEATVFYTFAFIFLLAVYGVWRERQHVREARILALLFPVLVLAHVMEPQMNVEFSGERYYFEAFFAVAILAARGLALLTRDLRTSRRAFVTVLSLFVAIQVAQHAVAGQFIVNRSKPYREMRLAAERFKGRHYLIFWRTTPPRVFGKHFNLNRPDWQKQDLFYLVDPGPSERSQWACRFARPQWVVIGYDAGEQTATEEQGRAGECAGLERAAP